jgi:hypothetical protein
MIATLPPSSRRSSWLRLSSRPVAIRPAVASVGLVSPRSTWLSIGALTPDRSARSRRLSPPASRRALILGPTVTVIRPYVIAYDVRRERVLDERRREPGQRGALLPGMADREDADPAVLDRHGRRHAPGARDVQLGARAGGLHDHVRGHRVGERGAPKGTPVAALVALVAAEQGGDALDEVGRRVVDRQLRPEHLGLRQAEVGVQARVVREAERGVERVVAGDDADAGRRVVAPRAVQQHGVGVADGGRRVEREGQAAHIGRGHDLLAPRAEEVVEQRDEVGGRGHRTGRTLGPCLRSTVPTRWCSPPAGSSARPG